MEIVIGKRKNELLTLQSKTLQKHLVALGGSGSGKTVLLKGIIEEAALQGIPSIVFDLQGDLSSLGLKASLEEVQKNGRSQDSLIPFSNVSVRIYTPGAEIGLPLRISPFVVPKTQEYDEQLLNVSVANLINLLGYTPSSEKYQTAAALLRQVLSNQTKHQTITELSELIDLLLDQQEALQEETLCSEAEIKTLIKKLKTTLLSPSAKLLTHGIPLSIDLFMNKNQISVIYLNHLVNEREKDFFITTFVMELYRWMLHHPSQELQLLFCLDEIAPYLPAGMKQTAAKESLKLFFKQARKYGIGCLVATQNPGDIDYKAFAQFSTWCLGRLTTEQDRKKVKESLESFGTSLDIKTLASMQQGHFLLFSPDEKMDITDFQTQWLLSRHKTLTEGEIKELMQPYQPLLPTEKKKKFEIDKGSFNVSQQKSYRYVQQNFSEEEIHETIEKNRKKISLFPSKKEEVASITTMFFPLLKLQIRGKEKKLLGFSSETKEFDILVDLYTGDVLQYKNGSMKKKTGLQDLFTLQKDEILLLKKLISGVEEEEALAKMLNLSDYLLKKNLLSLKRKGHIEQIKKDTSKSRWRVTKRSYLPPSAEKLHTDQLSYGVSEKGKKLPENIDQKQVILAITTWFGYAIVNTMVVYLPVVEMILQGKHKRIIQFNGFTKEKIQ
ncbi:ATP-binding protein [Candidatus Woesearchaeota archaeon]|nr:ATP-binding protein [Candidatus Woesearchaeota archaeon]